MFGDECSLAQSLTSANEFKPDHMAHFVMLGIVRVSIHDLVFHA